MKQFEKREVEVIYCKYCHEEIKGKVHTLRSKDGSDNHYCIDKKKGEKDNCLVKRIKASHHETS